METYFYSFSPENIELLRRQLHTQIHLVYSNGASFYSQMPIIEFELYLGMGNNLIIYSIFDPTHDCSADICKLSFEEETELVYTQSYSIVDKKIATNYVKFHINSFEVSQIDIYKISYQDEYENIDWENILLLYSQNGQRILIYPETPLSNVCFVYDSVAIDNILKQRNMVFSRSVV